MSACPVCGKGEYVKFGLGQGVVSHLACVEKLEAENERWKERFDARGDNLKKSRAKLAALKAEIARLNDICDRLAAAGHSGP